MNFEIPLRPTESPKNKIEPLPAGNIEDRRSLAIEYLKTIERPEDRLALGLLIKGTKPAALLSDKGFTLTAVQASGLPFYLRGRGVENSLPIVVAQDEQILEELRRVQDLEDGHQHNIELGHLLGYPDTAVKAFGNHEIIDRDLLPASVHESGILEFVTFSFSEDHWREELETLKEQIRSVADIDPELMNKVDWQKLEEAQ